MDGEDAEKHRSYIRKKIRWSLNSMSSQRIEDIISQLMQPVNDISQNFDTKLCSLLEDYLTEVGLHHIDAEEQDEFTQPNFAEIALLIQQSVLIYGKKVDFLYQHVMDMADNMASSAHFRDDDDKCEELIQTPGRRKRKASDSLNDFQTISLEESSSINMKDADNMKPPLRLPKSYIEFEPRIISAKDVKLYDYKGEIIGVMNDFHVNWSMDANGMLVDDLDSSSRINKEMLVPLNVRALNQIPESLISPPDSSNNSDCDIDLNRSQTEMTPKEPIEITSKMTVKRKHPEESFNPHYLVKGSNNTRIDMKSWCKRLKIEQCCFELPFQFIERVIERRKQKILKLRRKMSAVRYEDCVDSTFALDTFVLQIDDSTVEKFHMKEFLKGLKMIATEWKKDCLKFDTSSHPDDVGTGCIGFTQQEVDESEKESAAVRCAFERNYKTDETNFEATIVYEHNEVDDGFYEQTNSDLSCTEEMPTYNFCDASTTIDQTEITKRVEAWHALIRPRLEKAEKRGDFDVHRYGHILLESFKENKQNFSQVVCNGPQEDVSRYFLAALMLANTGNIELVGHSKPLMVGDFQLKLKTKTDALYKTCNPFE